MNHACHEIVVFRAAPGVAPQQLADALATVDTLIREQPGFISRTTLHDPDTSYWIDHIAWASRSNAMQALEQLNTAPLAAALFAQLDQASVLMLHGQDVRAGERSGEA
jgi:hypothetical protein